VAFAAVETLGSLGQPADDDALCVAVTRADPEVAKAAARALGDRPRPAAREALIGVLAHPRWDVRRAAAQALANHPRSPEILAALRARVAVEDDALVGEALDAALRQP
jgi:HEAT repeat protein